MVYKFEEYVNKYNKYIDKVCGIFYYKEENAIIRRFYTVEDFKQEYLLTLYKGFKEYDNSKCDFKTFFITICSQCASLLKRTLFADKRAADRDCVYECQMQSDNGENEINVFENIVYEEDFDQNEFIDYDVFTDEEIKIIGYLQQGYKYAEIYDLMGYGETGTNKPQSKRTRVWRKVQNIREKIGYSK